MEWLDTLLQTAEKFIVTPREQLEYEAQLARARADESLAAAQLAAAGQQSKQMGTILLGAVVIGVGLIAFQAMK